MGQYLTIGIATHIVADKERAERLFGNVDDFKSAFEKEFNDSNIYQMKETDTTIVFDLKPDVAEPELLDFVRAFYELRYAKKRDYNDVLEALSKENTLQGWLNIADEKRFECFQTDEYVRYPIESPSPFSNLYINVEQIILSIDGKIVMECYNDLFAFFTRLLRTQFEKYRLTNSLLVYISG